jgi:hypothetical protein
MYKKSSFLTLISLILSLPTATFAICLHTIASYEPVEVNDLIVSPNPAMSPTLDVNWPVRGGVDGVPEATEGKYVLKLSWTNEADRKIEISHHWTKSSFDLEGVTYILLDVYFATQSALPEPENKNISIWTVWDSNTHWISCEHVPPITNEWYTVAFYVGNLHYNDLNDIDAIAFEKMGALNDRAGTIYIDNLQLATESPLYPYQCPYFGRKIKFSGYWWQTLQSNWQMGAGPNYYTDNPNDIWVDPNGLHLKIVNKAPNWYCTEAIANENFGYGTYVFTLKDDANSLDPNMVLGTFTYDVPDANGRPREIDIEFTRWGNQNDPNNAQFAVQPANSPDLLYRFRTGNSANTTHVITWKPSRIDFSSYQGEYTPHPRGKDIINFWSYTGDDIPKPGCDNPRINFYLMNGKPPVNGQNAEIVLKSFRYVPLGDLDNDNDVDFVDFALFAQKWLVDVK